MAQTKTLGGSICAQIIEVGFVVLDALWLSLTACGLNCVGHTHIYIYIRVCVSVFAIL